MVRIAPKIKSFHGIKQNVERVVWQQKNITKLLRRSKCCSKYWNPHHCLHCRSHSVVGRKKNLNLNHRHPLSRWCCEIFSKPSCDVYSLSRFFFSHPSSKPLLCRQQSCPSGREINLLKIIGERVAVKNLLSGKKGIWKSENEKELLHVL